MTSPIELAPGELYIGRINDTHVVLLPADNDDATWQEQMDWAKSIGGHLPNRIEQAMLLANFRDQFKEDWYWSNETHASDSGCAWFQGLSQHYGHKGYKLRARAVRRVEVSHDE